MNSQTHTGFLQIIICSFFLFPFFTSNAQSQTGTTDEAYIYLVRHAEKADDSTKDPPLTDRGMSRANRLSKILKGANISAIYSTDYKRTRNTAQPLASALGKEVIIYNPRDEDFRKQLVMTKGNVLIVGHSNSTPSLANALIGKESYEQLDESVYTKLFVLCRIGDIIGSSTMDFMTED